LFKEIVKGLEEKQHSDKEKLKELIKKAFQMNYDGKQRRYSITEVFDKFKK